MIDTKELRRLAKEQEWIGRWYDAGCETLMAERDGEHEEVAHPMPIGLVPYLVAVQPAAITELLDRLEAAEKAVTEAYQRGYATGQEEIAAELEFAKREVANLHDDISEWMDKCDALRAKIERADRLEKVESALSDLLNDLEDRAKWNLEASQRVVACGNGVYVRAKAALEESK